MRRSTGRSASKASTPLSHSYAQDELERQTRELELDNHRLRRTASFTIAGNTQAHVLSPHHKVLVDEIARLRDENRSLEVQGAAFKQKMEAAVNSFEQIVEDAASENTALLMELDKLRQERTQMIHEAAPEVERESLTAAMKTAELKQTGMHDEHMRVSDALPYAKVRFSEEEHRLLGISGIVREHQIELAESYRFSGALKLRAAIDTRAVVDLSLAFSLWTAVAHFLVAKSTQEQNAGAVELCELHVGLEQAKAELLAQRDEIADLEKARDDATASSLKARADAMQIRMVADRELSDLREELRKATLLATEAENARAVDRDVSQRADEAADSTCRAKALERMFCEQQAELSDGYRLAATSKLGALVDRQSFLWLHSALTTWRLAVACSSMQALESQYRTAAAESRAMSARTRDLQSQFDAGQVISVPGRFRPPRADQGRSRSSSPVASLANELEGALIRPTQARSSQLEAGLMAQLNDALRSRKVLEGSSEQSR